MKRLIAALKCSVLFFLVGCTVVSRVSDDDQPPVPIGSALPDFQVASLTNSSTSHLSDYKGKVVLIDFWATWCGPCVESLPHNEALHKELASKGLQVMAISNEDAGTVRTFMSEQKYTMPTFIDVGGSACEQLHVSAYPTLMIVDRSGKLAYFTVGETEESELRDELKKLGIG